MARVIYETSLKDLVSDLSKKNTVFVPALTNPESAFSEYGFVEFQKDTVLAFDYPTTSNPPKEFLLPPTDTLFEFQNNKIKKIKPKKQVIFGVSAEDLSGLSKLETLFLEPITDEHFKEIKNNTVIVAIDRFSPPKNEVFDLYLMKINAEVFVGYAKTKAGQEILRGPHFKTQRVIVPSVKRKGDALLSNPDLAKIVENSKDHPVWNELAQVCFGCGICSFVCPLCHCFETEDVIDFGTEACPSGKRCRNWDSCLLAGFAKTTGGDFRPELKDRIYNWYYHKFVRMPKEHGFSGCVDCNRCIIYCPAKINYRKVLMRLVSDYKDKK